MKHYIELINHGKLPEVSRKLAYELKESGPDFDKRIYALYLIVYAMTHISRHPDETKLQDVKFKQLLLEVRHQVFGHIFPSFLLSFESALENLLPPILRHDKHTDCSFLSRLRDIEGSLSGEERAVGFFESYDSFKIALDSGNLQVLDTVNKIKREWSDLVESRFFYEYAEIRPGCEIQGLINNTQIAPKFSEAQAIHLFKWYLAGKIDLYYIHKSKAFSDAITPWLCRFEFAKKKFTIRQLFVLSEILRKSGQYELMLEIFSRCGRPKELLVKNYLAATYAFGSKAKLTQVLGKQLSDSHRKKAELAKPFRSKPNRRARLAVFTADIGHHAVSYFLSPLFAKHSEHGWDLILFANCDFGDDASSRPNLFAAHATEAHSIKSVPGNKVSQLLKEANPDLVLELNGLVPGARYDGIPLTRDFPVVHYLGSNDTTFGLADYVICDPMLNFEGRLQKNYTEKLITINHWMCYDQSLFQPNRRDTLIREKPTGLRDKFLIGFFNHLTKCGPKTKDWLLNLLISSDDVVLLIAHGSNTKFGFAKFLESMPDDLHKRIIFDDRIISWADHQSRVSMCDVVVDAIDHVSGGTTTCDALAMGTPVVTSAAREMTLGARMTLSVLRSAGLLDLSFRDLAQPELVREISYSVGKGKALADCVSKSQLCNADDYADNIYGALQKLIR